MSSWQYGYHLTIGSSCASLDGGVYGRGLTEVGRRNASDPKSKREAVVVSLTTYISINPMEGTIKGLLVS